MATMCKNPAMSVQKVTPHVVAVLALEGVVAFELGLPHRFLRSADPSRPYAVRVVTLDDGPVTTSAGYQVLPTDSNTLVAQADSIVVPGIVSDIVTTGRLPVELVRLASTARPEARWISICTGAFVLAGLGMLNGREATTHWCHTEAFARHFPLVHLNPDVLYVDHGDIVTAAGNAAGIDVMLHVLRTDHGAEVANDVARRAVVAPWRAGGQAQFISRPVPESTDAGTGPTRAWLLEHLHEPISLEQMARHAGMSPRTFTRRFREETGETAVTWLTRARVDRARHLLETSDLPVDRVAGAAGFGTATSLRAHLAAAVGLSPVAYRRTYRAEPA